MRAFRLKIGAGLRWLVSVPDGGEGLVAAAPVLPLRAVVRRFWPYARPYRRWLLVSAVLVVAVPIAETVAIWLFKLVVDDVLVPRDLAALWPIALGFLGLTIVGGLLAFADDYLSTWVGERFVLNLRQSVFRHVLTLSLDFFERRRLGDVLSRLTGDVSSIETLVLSGVADGVSYALRVVLFTGALFVLQWQLALVSVLVTPLFWIAARSFSKRIKRASREKRRRSGSITAVAEESLSNAQLVQAYNREDTEADRLERENVAAMRAELAATRLKGLFSPTVDVIELIGVMIVFAVGTWELSRGALTLGGLLVFCAYLSRLYSPIRSLSRLANTFFSASASAERIIELLDERPAVELPRHPRRIGAACGLLELDAVSFSYPGRSARALTDVSLRARPGEMLALVGASGAGKSTVAKLLLRFYDPSAGRVTLDGIDLRELELRGLREQIALLLQETLAFDGTVRDNIAYGRRGATELDVVRAASAADAHQFITELPDGYDTVIGQKGRRLSGGQRQRIAIARALVRDAPILILDEPTTGLDADTTERLVAPLRRLMEGRTTIVISHNMLTVADATRIVVLDHGRIVETGTHEELLARGESYARLHRLHRGGGGAVVELAPTEVL